MSLGRKWLLTLGAMGLILIALVLIVRAGSNDDEISGEAPPANYNQVQAGMSMQQVSSLLGQPEKTGQDQTSPGSSAECWYYGAPDSGTYQVCFQGDKVAYKSGTGTQAAP